MLELSFHQTKSEMMVRAASTIIFKALSRNKYPLIKLSEIAEKPQYGFTASASFEPNKFKYIRITDLKDGSIKWDTTPYCECNEPEKYLIQSGDILFARTGATTGKTHLVKESKNAVFASYLIRLRPKKNNDSEYLYCFFQSDSYWSQIADQKKGSAQPNVNGRKLLNIKLPIVNEELKLAVAKFLEAVRKRQDGSNEELPELPPPLEEQRRIVAKVEELAGKIEEARSIRKQTIKETEALFISTLSKLTTSNKVSSKKLEDVCLQITDGEHNTPPRTPIEEIPLATAKNVRDGYLDLSITDFVETNTAQKCWRRCKPQNEDILMVCVGATTGRVCRLVNPPAFVIVRSVALLRPNHDIILSRFFEYVLKSSDCQTQIWANVKRTAQPCLYLNKMKRLSVPIPKISEQRRIVAYLDRLQSKVDEMKRLREKALQELDALLPSILDKAFKGEL